MTSRQLFTGRSPPFIHTDELADLLNKAAGCNKWDARKVRRLLTRTGALVEQNGGRLGGRFVTTVQRLREALPDLWETIVGELPEAMEDE